MRPCDTGKTGWVGPCPFSRKRRSVSGDGRVAGFGLLAVLLQAGTVSAQTVQGMVFDEAGGQPLA